MKNILKKTSFVKKYTNSIKRQKYYSRCVFCEQKIVKLKNDSLEEIASNKTLFFKDIERKFYNLLLNDAQSCVDENQKSRKNSPLRFFFLRVVSIEK